MGRYTKPLELYMAQKERFDKARVSRESGYRMLREAMLADAKELTSGEPDGLARLKILEETRPFARGESIQASKPSAMRRGGGAGSLPLLPVGMISGKLRRSLRIRVLPKGFGLVADGAEYAKYVLGSVERGDSGTPKMVSRGFQKAITGRFKARFKAFLDSYRAQTNQP